jgi:hypothetical protein
MGMAMPRVFGRRQKTFAAESVLLGAAKRHRALSENPPSQGREIPVRNFMDQFEAQASGSPDGGILKGMKG